MILFKLLLLANAKITNILFSNAEHGSFKIDPQLFG